MIIFTKEKRNISDCFIPGTFRCGRKIVMQSSHFSNCLSFVLALCQGLVHIQLTNEEEGVISNCIVEYATTKTLVAFPQTQEIKRKD